MIKKVINKKFNTYPYILHFPGKAREKRNFSYYADSLTKNNIKINSNISIITCATKSYLNSPLLKQLKLNNIKFYNEAENLDIDKKYGNWNNRYKWDIFLKALYKCETPYTIILDSADTFILKSLDDKFIDLFLEFNCDIVYNATTNPIPKDNLVFEKLDDLIKINSHTKYLNSGVCFGKTESLIKMIELMKTKYIDWYNKEDDDQFMVRLIQNDYPNIIKVDYYNILFQIINDQTYIVENKNNIEINYILDKFIGNN